MSDHKFKVGQTLQFKPHRMNISVGPGRCKVIRLMATDGSDPQYRIRCTNESFERVAHESELG